MWTALPKKHILTYYHSKKKLKEIDINNTKMNSDNKFKESVITNRTCYYFDDMINNYD